MRSCETKTIHKSNPDFLLYFGKRTTLSVGNQSIPNLKREKVTQTRYFLYSDSYQLHLCSTLSLSSEKKFIFSLLSSLFLSCSSILVGIQLSKTFFLWDTRREEAVGKIASESNGL